MKKITLRPCDCKDSVDACSLQEQGIRHNDQGITVIPRYVELQMGHTTVSIGMDRFKMFAEWYLEPQEVRKSYFISKRKTIKNNDTSIK